jgi:hypothetical protein
VCLQQLLQLRVAHPLLLQRLLPALWSLHLLVLLLQLLLHNTVRSVRDPTAAGNGLWCLLQQQLCICLHLTAWGRLIIHHIHNVQQGARAASGLLCSALHVCEHGLRYICHMTPGCESLTAAAGGTCSTGALLLQQQEQQQQRIMALISGCGSLSRHLL